MTYFTAATATDESKRQITSLIKFYSAIYLLTCIGWTLSFILKVHIKSFISLKYRKYGLILAIQAFVFVLKCSLLPSAGRFWWCCHNWKEMPAFRSPTAWLTVKQPRPRSETGPPPRLPTVRSSPQILMACTGQGLYDHRLLSPAQTLPFCQTTGKSVNPSAVPRDAYKQLSTVLHLLRTPLQLASAHSLAKRMCHVRMKQGKRFSFPQTNIFCTGAVYGTGIALPPTPHTLGNDPVFGSSAVITEPFSSLWANPMQRSDSNSYDVYEHSYQPVDSGARGITYQALIWYLWAKPKSWFYSYTFFKYVHRSYSFYTTLNVNLCICVYWRSQRKPSFTQYCL